MRTTVTGWLIFLVTALSYSAMAAPFAKRILFEQPDGTMVEIWGEGDEFRAVFESMDGYSVVYDPAARAYCYASLSTDGNDLVSTGQWLGRGNPQASGLTRHLRILPASAKAKADERFRKWDAGTQISKRWKDKKTALQSAETASAGGGVALSPPAYTTTGTKVGLCLLVDFDDDPATKPQAEIVNFCNGETYTGDGNNGSVRKYFQDNSGGLLTYSNVVTVYIRIPNTLHPKSWYNDPTKDCGAQGNLLIWDAIAIMKALPNYATEILPAFNVLTVDGANNVVACNVFYAGGNGGVWSFGLWPHSWVLANVGAQELSAGGKKVYPYQITDIGSSLELGTFCHENGHMLCDYPDIYDYDYDSVGGAGNFCLMNDGGQGANPAQICAYLKRASGWATVVDLNSGSLLAASVSSSGTNFNRFYRYFKPGVSTEYFLVENRQATGRDATLPAGGVAIWHIDEYGDRDNQSMTANKRHRNYEVTLVQADNLWHFENNVNSGDANDLYYSGNTAAGYTNRLSDKTTPHAHWWDGTSSGLNFRDFSAKGTTMTFMVEPVNTPPVFSALAASPSPAKLGAAVNITFTASTSLAANPTVTVDTHAAAFQSKVGYNYSYAYTIQSSDPDGDATLVIAGTDGAGKSGATTNITALDVDKTAPRIISITSTNANGTYGLGAEIDIRLEFSEPVTLSGGNLVLTLETGVTDRQVTNSIMIATNRVAGIYTVQYGDASADLTVSNVALAGSMLRDAAGNAADLALPAGQNLNDTKNLVIHTLLIRRGALFMIR